MLPSGTVTFLFTDIEGSTPLWERDREAMRSAMAHHDDLLRRAVDLAGGVVIKHTGDGMLAAFISAAAGIGAALQAQRELEAGAANAAVRMRVRMGLHAGTAAPVDGDYLGPTVAKAARVMAAAHGGQVVASQAVADLARDEMRNEWSLLDLGEYRLRGFSRPERLFQLGHPELPARFPPLRTVDAVRGNLPLLRTSFLGRDGELARLRQMLDAEPLVTIVGSGGVGKTTLALHAATQAVADFPDGAWLVELAPLRNGAHLLEAIAGVLGVASGPGERLEQAVTGWFRTRRALLVVDNCEHILAHAAGLTKLILDAGLQVRVLTTSREPLRITGERLFELLPFSPLQGEDVDLAAAPAVQLFCERAAAIRPGFEADAGELRTIATVCDQLDGVPLAIELAAARMRLLRPTDLAVRLSDRFRLLRTTGPASGTHHDSLEAAIAWSYDLLDTTERGVLDRLSVFAGAFDLEAAEALAAGDDIDQYEVLNQLERLVAKSLVIADHGSSRYRLLATVREYSSRQLEGVCRREVVERRHAEHYLQRAEQAAEFLEFWPDGSWLSRAAACALAWLGDADPAASLAREAIAELQGISPGLASRICNFIGMALGPSSLEASTAMFEKAMALGQSAGSRYGEACGAMHLGFNRVRSRDFHEAAVLLTEDLPVLRDLGSHREVAFTLQALAASLLALGAVEQAATLYGATDGLRRNFRAPRHPAGTCPATSPARAPPQPHGRERVHGDLEAR